MHGGGGGSLADRVSCWRLHSKKVCNACVKYFWIESGQCSWCDGGWRRREVDYSLLLAVIQVSLLPLYVMNLHLSSAETVMWRRINRISQRRLRQIWCIFRRAPVLLELWKTSRDCLTIVLNLYRKLCTKLGQLYAIFHSHPTRNTVRYEPSSKPTAVHPNLPVLTSWIGARSGTVV
jgi:hypothetical protein